MAGTQRDFNELKDFFQRIMERGMDGYAGAVWPVIVRRWMDRLGDSPEGKYVYEYPERFFQNLRHKYDIFVYAEKKSDRLKMLKYLVDELMAKRIDIHLYHFGMNLLYPYASRDQKEDEEAVGKKRSEFMSHLPRFELKSNDEFVSNIWSDLILRRYPEVGEEIVTVPSFSQLRILFTADNFGDHTGTYYFDADWVEPIPGLKMKVKKWVGEKDPMTPQPKKDGMIEGPITLGHEGSGNGLRHFVAGKPIHAGSYIEIKFGDGWIPGRYEWSFEMDSPIRIHSSRHEWISIHEGQLVRVKA
ncbi:hypothetical protein [Paenibacillus polymyxa]|uniref:hypothetical protein n=1 Tax=Paenibacillus polymyxa TaxID=1406 RepID=UPI001FD3FB1B|nr:hypothetical protein [Paenibacillus polymyxa]